MRDRRNNVDSPHPDTCGWILKQEGYQNWLRNARGLLWIKGKPGAGKSTLMNHIYEDFRKKHLPRGDIILEFFFSARGTDLQKSAVGMFRSLLHQLYVQQASSRSIIQHLFDEKRALGPNCHWQPKELERLLIDALMACSQPRQITVFIDALDEAGENNAKALATYFHRLNDRVASSQKNTKICISCRHFPVFAYVSSVEICVEDHNREDISAFLHSELDLTKILNGHLISSSAWSGLIDNLTDKARGLFQWASIVAPIVRNCVAEGRGLAHIQLEMLSLPSELDDVYSHILESITSRRDPSETLHLLQWICFAERPLSVREVKLALAFDDVCLRADDADGISDLRDDQHCLDARMTTLIITLSGGLVEVAKVGGRWDVIREVVQVVHQSVNDYLYTTGFGILMSSVPQAIGFRIENHPYSNETDLFSRSHHRLFRSCLNYIDRGEIRWHIYLSLHDTEYPEHQLRLRQEGPFLEYACYSLFRHLAKAQKLHLPDEYLCREIDTLREIFKKWCIAYQLLNPFQVGTPLHGTSLLHIACVSGLRRVVKYQIDIGESADEADYQHNNALHYAARNGDIEIGRILIEAGANLGSMNCSYENALHIAASNGHREFAELLIKQGIQLRGGEEFLETPLHVAAVNGQVSLVRLLLEHGESVNAQGGFYGTPLQAASYRGYKNIAQLLIERGADINGTGGEYGTALRAAAWQGHKDIVRLLVERGADVNAPGRIFGSALQAAARWGHEDIIQLLLDRGADINARNEQFDSALQLVSVHGSTKAVSLLLQAGADMNMRKHNGLSLLASTAIEGKTKVVELLLNKGVGVNDQDQYGATALIYATVRGETDVVNLLLDKGAATNVLANEFGTALHLAVAIRNNPGIVQLLLERGADISVHGGIYGTVLQAASSDGQEVIDLLYRRNSDMKCFMNLVNNVNNNARKTREMVTLLLKKGVDVNEKGGKYHTALQAAAASRRDNSAEIVELLLEWRAEVNTHGGTFGNALQAAARRANYRIVKLLVENGANVHALGGEYGTVLQAAAAGGNKKIVEQFLRMGADIDEQAGRHGTALQAAVIHKRYGVVRLLLESGTNINVQTEKGTTALCAAVRAGLYKTAKLLLEHGADMRTSILRRGNALDVAKRHGHIRLVKLLLKHDTREENYKQRGEIDTDLVGSDDTEETSDDGITFSSDFERDPN